MERITYSQEQVNVLIKLHRMWLDGDPCGARAEIASAVLQSVVIPEYSNLSGCVFKDVSMFDVKANKVDFSGAVFQNSTLMRVDMSSSNCNNVSFYETDVYETTFHEASMKDATLFRGIFVVVDFSCINFGRTTFTNNTFQKLNFEKSSLIDTNASTIIKQAREFGGNVDSTIVYKPNEVRGLREKMMKVQRDYDALSSRLYSKEEQALIGTFISLPKEDKRRLRQYAAILWEKALSEGCLV